MRPDLRWRATASSPSARRQTSLRGCWRSAGDFILHGQYVGQLPAVAFAPQRRVIARVDEAHVNPHLAASALHSTFDDEPDSKLARDFAQGRLVPICESAVRRDHPQASNSPQLRRDRLRHAIGKVLVAAVDRTEWKHCH